MAFAKYRISKTRGIFWLGCTLVYWLLIALAWPATRERVFLGYEIFSDLLARRPLSEITSNMPEILDRTAEAMSFVGSMPALLMIVPVVMAFVMFNAPFAFRGDSRLPIRGRVRLPFTTLICYLFAILVSIVFAACVELGLYYFIGTHPTPDFFVFLCHPLYLVWPTAMANVWGLLSQIIYLLFTMSVLTTPGRTASAAEDKEEIEEPEDDESSPSREDEKNRAVPVWHEEEEPQSTDDDITEGLLMEGERLCRILRDHSLSNSAVHEVRMAIRTYSGDSRRVNADIVRGMDRYKMVLLESAKTLRAMIEKDIDRETSCEGFDFIIDEMERLSYCTKKDAAMLHDWVAKHRGA